MTRNKKTPTEREALARAERLYDGWLDDENCKNADLIRAIASAITDSYVRGRAAGIEEGRSDCHESCCWDPQKCRCNDRALLTAEEK